MSIADADKIAKEVARLRKQAKERAAIIEKEKDKDKKEQSQMSLEQDLWTYDGMDYISFVIRGAGAAGDSKFIIENSIKVENHLIDGMVEEYKKKESGWDASEKKKRMSEIEKEKWKVKGKQKAAALL